MSIHIQYIDAPVGAAESADVQVTAHQPFGAEKQLLSGTEDVPWANLERGGWALNGASRLIPDNAQKLGWWSEQLSGDDGRFSNPPVIVISFANEYTVDGLSFRFWPSMNQWCSEMEVSWHRGEELIAKTVAAPNSAEWYLEYSVEYFDRIEIKLNATNSPNQFAKLQSVLVGKTEIFFSDEIIEATLLNETDPSLCQMTVDTMTVKIRDKKNRALLPKKDQTIHLYRDGVRIAAHYIAESEQESKSVYTLRCQSAIGLLEDDYLGGMYLNAPLSDLLKEILLKIPFSIDEAFSQTLINGYLPVCTQREALQQISFAIGALVTTQGDGTIRLAPLESDISGKFIKADLFFGAKVKRESPVSSVKLIAHSYEKDYEEVVIFDEEVTGKNVLLTFPEPHHRYSFSGSWNNSYGANWVQVNPDNGKSRVTITAGKYIHKQKTVTREIGNYTHAERKNTVTIDNATLIHTTNADSAIDRLAAFYELNRVLEQDAVIQGQYAGQMVDSESPWGNHIAGYITGLSSTFTRNGQIASVEIRGREVENL